MSLRAEDFDWLTLFWRALEGSAHNINALRALNTD